ncbi:MAG: hypothetical protein LQ351_007615 [Letrouitia transgressa]|nr:MAG: hypothetical protein LQ351_007615 [Letrouitia transgressa]
MHHLPTSNCSPQPIDPPITSTPETFHEIPNPSGVDANELRRQSAVTPTKATPNSSKKRVPLDLSRVNASPSHYSKMRALFEDANAVLQKPPAPTADRPTPAKMLRRPFSTTDCLKPGLVPVGCYGPVQETGKREPGASPEVCAIQRKTKGPVNGGFTNSMKIGGSPHKDSQAVRYLDLRSRKSASALPRISFSKQHQSQGTDVETWLKNVPDSPRPSPQHRLVGFSFDIASTASSLIGSGHGSQRSPQMKSSRYRLPAATSSEKENISPSKIPVATRTSSPAKPVVSYPRLPNSVPESDLGIKKVPTRFSLSLVQNMGSNSGAALHCPPSLTSREHIADTTKEKRSPPGLGPNMPSPRNRASFAIHDEVSVLPSSEISPNVECHRKGHGTRRERCASYWDEDIFPNNRTTPTKTSQPDSKKEEDPGEGQGDAGSLIRNGKGRAVLVETAASDELTKAKPFSKGLEDHKFDFESGYTGSLFP